MKQDFIIFGACAGVLLILFVLSELGRWLAIRQNNRDEMKRRNKK